MRKHLLLVILTAVIPCTASIADEKPAGTSGKEKVTVQEKKVVHAGTKTARWSAEINVVDLAWYFTPNIKMQYAVAQKWTLEANAKYNNWTFNEGDYDNRNRQARQTYNFGFRFWPWYTYSGWWVGAKAQYSEYSWRPMNDIRTKEEGDAFGLAVSAGYSFQVAPWFNIDVGLGGWGGRKYYKVYYDGSSCPTCGKRIDATSSEPASEKWFFLPDEITIGAMFVF